MKGMGNMMKQAQKLQSKMLKMQEELAGRKKRQAHAATRFRHVEVVRTEQGYRDDPSAERMNAIALAPRLDVEVDGGFARVLGAEVDDV